MCPFLYHEYRNIWRAAGAPPVLFEYFRFASIIIIVSIVITIIMIIVIIMIIIIMIIIIIIIIIQG